MSQALFLLILVVVLCAGCVKTTDGAVVGCYYSSWSVSRPSPGQYGVSDLPTNLCTHIMYTFYTMSTDGTVTAPEEATYTDTSTSKTSSIDAFLDLKDSAPDVKLLVSFGGWTGSTNFSVVVNDDTARANFVANIVTLLEDKGFDGVDLAWDYPGLRNGVSTDKAKFIELLSELKEALGDEYLLTGAVAVTQYYIDAGYDVSGLATYLDYIFIQTYEYHGTWDGVTGANAPTYAQTTDSASTNLNVNNSIAVWIKNGAPASKLVLGLASFAKTFTLDDADNTDTGATTTGAGKAGPYSEEAGVLTYYEVCEYIQNDTSSWTVVEEPDNYVYAYNDLQWFGYDNPNTIRAKGQLAKQLGLAGIFMWAVDEDDFAGKCGDAYPLLTSAIDGYNDSE